MRYFSFAITAFITLVIIVVLDREWGSVPPFGKLVSPSHGFWQNATPVQKGYTLEVKSNSLQDSVQVYLDERLIPHVFAQNDHDAYFVQGYLHAKFRLWQMEFQVMAAAGRLSEILGDQVGETNILEKHDRKMRRLGMQYAAENAVKALSKDPTSQAAVEAYASGVNYYIDNLHPAQYPLEYKLLNYEPEHWSSWHTAMFLKAMSLDLASDFDDIEFTNLYQKIGAGLMEQLFPIEQAALDPIIPKGTRFAFTTQLPTAPLHADSQIFKPLGIPDVPLPQPDPDNGSNNWVVAGSKTASGRPILCNDPHLGLTLPSIWYEIQIITPEYNTYGVSFPGTPSVVIGMNDSIAWGVTNAGRDVMDYYEVKFQDSTMNQYWFNGSWRKTEWRTETIRIKGKADYSDKVALTVWGPVMYDANYPVTANDTRAIAVRWKAHDPSNELLTFMQLNRAHNYDDFRSATLHFSCPGQNFVFASKANQIAFRQQGEFPAKWRRQGDYLMPGWDSTFAWQGIIAPDEVGVMVNPERGFVSSANQRIGDTITYPFHYGSMPDVYRGLIINRYLNEMTAITPDRMKKMQTDNYNVFAEKAAPLLLSNVQENLLNEEAKNLLNEVKIWNYRADADSKGMTIFFNWWNALADTLLTDDLRWNKTLKTPWPQDIALLEILEKNPGFAYVDNQTTPGLETLQELVTSALAKTTEKLHQVKAIEWGAYKATRVNHLLPTLTPFARTQLNVGGGSKIINATKETHGPSWRVVVHLTDTLEAYGVYPGGQEGNPGSPYYDQFVNTWAKGEYYRLWIMNEQERADSRIKWTMKFSK